MFKGNTINKKSLAFAVTDPQNRSFPARQTRTALVHEPENALDDNALMLKVKAGALSLLGLLFERYHKALYSFFYRLTNGASELSEDLVQTVFLRMLTYRHTFTGSGKFIAWMYHMARNVFADHYRKHKKQGYRDELKKVEQNPDYSSTPDDREEELQLLDKALQHLSPDKRELIILSKYEEMPYRDIALVLGCSEGNVKVKVFRAVQELKVIYKKLDQEVRYDG